MTKLIKINVMVIIKLGKLHSAVANSGKEMTGRILCYALNKACHAVQIAKLTSPEGENATHGEKGGVMVLFNCTLLKP